MQLNSKILRRICPIRLITCLRQTDKLSVESHFRRHSNDTSTWMDTLCLCVIIYYNVGKLRGEAVVAPVFFTAHRRKVDGLSLLEHLDSFGHLVIEILPSSSGDKNEFFFSFTVIFYIFLREVQKRWLSGAKFCLRAETAQGALWLFFFWVNSNPPENKVKVIPCLSTGHHLLHITLR